MKNYNLDKSESSPDTARGQGRKIKLTTSICPQCLASIGAQVLERGGEVWMDKSCDQHGRFSALLSSDIKHYFEPSAQPMEGKSCCGSSCGQPGSALESMDDSAAWANHSCTILIEITERCNLTCPTCFAGSSPQHSSMMELDEFTRQVDQLVAGGKSGSDMIQLSGGEPTIHPQFFKMVALLFDRGFKKVCINSNGIKLAQAAFTRKLAECTFSLFVNQEVVLAEVRRVLKPSGQLGITDMAVGGPLPGDIASIVAPWTCMVDAVDQQAYAEKFTAAGFEIKEFSDESAGLLSLIGLLKRKLLLLGVGSVLVGGNVPQFDIAEIKYWLDRITSEVEKGSIRYLRFNLQKALA